ncbi:MAG: hypothetical protein ACI87W_002591, partial [Halieaceae bacterium]
RHENIATSWSLSELLPDVSDPAIRYPSLLNECPQQLQLKLAR